MDYKFDNTRLLVSNFKACFLFYQDIMGFKATYGNENDIYADFDTGESKLALFAKPNMSETVRTSHLPAESISQDKLCLVFTVADVDTMSKKVEQQGITLFTQPADRLGWGIRTAHFRDPDGNLIEIFQPLPPA